MTSRNNVTTKRKSTAKSTREKVLILGLGSYPQGTGVQSALYFAKKGADVLVTDGKPADKLGTNVKTLKRFKNVRFHLGGEKIKDIAWADVIVRNPGVLRNSPMYSEAVRLGKPLINDITVFLDKTPCLSVGVTGTRGKSTTTAWIHDMLERSGKKAFLGGNITVSPLTFMHKAKAGSVAVIELSSWLLEPCGANGLSPDIAVWTNVMSDHLNAYDGMEDYAEAKAQVMRNQGPEGMFVANLDDAYVSRYTEDAPGQVRGFSSKKRKGSYAWVSGGQLVLKRDGKESHLIQIDKVGLKGPHNIMNALAAIVGADAAGATLAGIKFSLKNFGGVPYRQQIVGTKNGVTFVNDTTSTTPDAAIAALNAFCSPKKVVHWICGGAHKGLDFAPLAATAKGKKLDVHMFKGTAFEHLSKEMEANGIPYATVGSMKEAFSGAAKNAKKGDVVLLSPACASFGLFSNEFDRGDQFNELVKSFKA